MNPRKSQLVFNSPEIKNKIYVNIEFQPQSTNYQLHVQSDINHFEDSEKIYTNTNPARSNTHKQRKRERQ